MGWEGGCRISLHQTQHEEFTASCGQSRTPAHSSLEEGEGETVRNGKRICVTDYRLCCRGLQENGKNVLLMILYLFFIQKHDKEKKNGSRQGKQDKLWFNKALMKLVLSVLGVVWFISHETMFTHSCQLVLWADWHLVEMGCLRKP